MGRPRVPNEWTVLGGSAFAVIRRNDGSEHPVVVDAADVGRVDRFRWSLRGRYAATHVPIGSGRYMRLFLHTFLALPPAGMEVDHIDGDTLNNRRSNLRVITHSENTTNVFRSGREHLRGVYPSMGGKRFQARVVVKGKAHHLGTFGTDVEAAAAARTFRLRNLPASNEQRGLAPRQE